MGLEGKLVVLDPHEAGSGPGASLGADGAAVLVVGEDAGAVGTAVAGLRAAGIRAAGFVGPASSPAVTEMAAELFPGLELA
jgi:hypothetical protein